ncbi:MAG: tyrosine-type recombinase/integrase [Thermoplasmatota archaeon]
MAGEASSGRSETMASKKDYEAKFRAAIRNLLALVPSQENRETLEAYQAEMEIKGIRLSSIRAHLVYLTRFSQALGTKRFQELNRADLVRYFATKQRLPRGRPVKGLLDDKRPRPKEPLGDLSVWTRNQTILQFLQWLHGGEELPEFAKGLRSKAPPAKSKRPEDLLTAAEVQALMAACRNARERAILACFLDGGFRCEELCSLNVGSAVKKDDGTVAMTLPEDAAGLKTGPRRVLLTESAPFVEAWLAEHPRRTDSLAPLFPLDKPPFSKRLAGHNVRYILLKATQRAGLKKHVHPHLFRHMAATEKAKKLRWSDQMMNNFFGWSKESTMASHYTNLSDQDRDEMILASMGKKLQEETRRRNLGDLVCPYCVTHNIATARFCCNCGKPLHNDAMTQVAKEEQERLRNLDWLARSLVDRLNPPASVLSNPTVSPGDVPAGKTGAAMQSASRSNEAADGATSEGSA